MSGKWYPIALGPPPLLHKHLGDATNIATVERISSNNNNDNNNNKKKLATNLVGDGWMDRWMGEGRRGRGERWPGADNWALLVLPWVSATRHASCRGACRAATQGVRSSQAAGPYSATRLTDLHLPRPHHPLLSSLAHLDLHPQQHHLAYGVAKLLFDQSSH